MYFKRALTDILAPLRARNKAVLAT